MLSGTNQIYLWYTVYQACSKRAFWGWSITEILTIITLTQTLNSPDVGTLHNRLLALPLFMPGIIA